MTPARGNCRYRTVPPGVPSRTPPAPKHTRDTPLGCCPLSPISLHQLPAIQSSPSGGLCRSSRLHPVVSLRGPGPCLPLPTPNPHPQLTRCGPAHVRVLGRHGAMRLWASSHPRSVLGLLPGTPLHGDRALGGCSACGTCLNPHLSFTTKPSWPTAAENVTLCPRARLPPPQALGGALNPSAQKSKQRPGWRGYPDLQAPRNSVEHPTTPPHENMKPWRRKRRTPGAPSCSAAG